ncbi:MAG: TrkH family potassium uptake protein, partial [Muribaculaceae bacterium]|nr:TrkH family potassium uptake protein [Muribaculaceae bacterium]
MKTTLRIRSIIRIMGRLVLIEAALMLLPLAVCVIYGEEDWKVFAMSSAVTGIAGLVAEISTRGTPMSLPGREGFILTALVWWVFGLFGMIPFMTGSCSLDFTDAMFEVISGFTTTGASMITDVEAQSHGILFWRAFTQWIGGLGIVFFMLAVLPELNRGAGISMYNAEATGITHDKLHPRIHQTALSVWGVYVCLTVLSVVLLWCGPMNFFDSVCQTFAAVSTGGFSTRNEGVGYWDSDYVYLVLIFVMFVAGVNFMLLYNAWKRGWRELFCNDVLKAYS